MLDFLELETVVSPTGVSFESVTVSEYAEDGLVVERGFRLMRLQRLGDRKPSLREAIDDAMGVESSELPVYSDTRKKACGTSTLDQSAQEVFSDISGGDAESTHRMMAEFLRRWEQSLKPAYWLCDGELYDAEQHNLFDGSGPLPGQFKIYTESRVFGVSTTYGGCVP